MSRHLLGLRDLSVTQIQHLLDLAQSYADGERPAGILAGRTLMTLFYEPSTRTEISFELAAKRAGAEVVRCDVDRSSVKKGESFVDTVQTLEALGADAIVIRHPMAGAPTLASQLVRCAVINAGDGMHEHPTQGLLDLLTVRQRKERIAGLKVALVGDVLHSRVARSAIWGFTKLGATVTLVGPPTLLLPGPREEGRGKKEEGRIPSPLPSSFFPFPSSALSMTSSLEEGLSGADVVMALRMQLERQQHGYVPSLAEYARHYGVTARTLAYARPDALLLHPGPMNLGVEITADAAYGPRSAIQTQVANGVAVRLAVLLWALDTDEKREPPRSLRELGAERGNAGTRERVAEIPANCPLPVIASGGNAPDTESVIASAAKQSNVKPEIASSLRSSQ